jgi:hypothetical protein
MRKGEEPRAPRHASAAATRDGNLPHSQQVYTLKRNPSLRLKSPMYNPIDLNTT